MPWADSEKDIAGVATVLAERSRVRARQAVKSAVIGGTRSVMRSVAILVVFSSLPAAAEETKARETDRLLSEGLRRLKVSDYRGAVDAFRSAIIESDHNVRAKAYFAIGLVVTSDRRNADKALRAAEAQGFSERPDLPSLFKDQKEDLRIKELLGAISGEGLLTAAWAEFLGGSPDRLKRLAEMEPVAKQLLNP